MGFFRLKTIRSRLFTTLVLPLAGLLVAVAVVWRFHIEPALRMDVAKNQQEVARRAADQIRQFIEERTHGLIAAAEIGHVWKGDMRHHKEVLYQLLKLDHQINEVSMVDASGQQIIRLSRLRVYTDADLTSLAGEELFRQAVQGNVYVSPIYYARTAEPLITLAVPIKFTARKITGILVAEVSLKQLWDSIAYIKVGKTGQAFVVDRKGSLIAHPDYSKVLLGTNMSHLHEVKEFLSNPDLDPDVGEPVIGQDGKRVMSAFARVEGLDWAVVVEEPVEAALAEVRRIERLAILLFVLMIVGAFGVSYFFSGRVATLVRRLEQGAKLIAQGDLEHKLDIRTGDEIESLANEFNRMARALKASYQGLEAKIVERTQEISALYSALAPLAAADSTEDMLKGVIERVLEVTGADAALIRILDRETGILLCPARIGVSSEFLEATQRVGEDSAIRTAFITGEPIIAVDIAADSRLKRKRQLQAGFVSCAFLPLRVKGELRGIIHLASRRLGHFNESKKNHLMAIAHQMGVAMENRELFEQTRHNLERIRALRELETAVTSTLDLGTILHALLEKVDVLFPGAGAHVRLFDKDRGFLEPIACRNIDEKEWKGRLPASPGRASKVLSAKTALKVRNIQTDPETRDPEFFRRQGLVSLLRVPLVAKEESLGVLSVYTKEEHEFSDEEVDFLSTLAGQAAIAIHNSQLYEEMAKLAADLSRSNKVRDEFLSVMSHELRTPLNVVMGYTGMIRDGLLGEINPEQEKALEKIISRARDQLTMISNILQATQLEAEGVKVEAHEVSLGDFLNDLRSSYALASGKELNIVWDYPPDLPAINTDSEKLKHVLQNLINNAIKFTERGTVTISARYLNGAGVDEKELCQQGSDGQNGLVQFKIADTGVGIAREHCAIIFERFRQVDSSETRRHGGVGIGLYIVKKFTEMLGGKIDVESEVGKGSTFTVTIPVADHQEAGKEEASERVSSR